MNLKVPVCHSEGRFSGRRNLLFACSSTDNRLGQGESAA